MLHPYRKKKLNFPHFRQKSENNMVQYFIFDRFGGFQELALLSYFLFLFFLDLRSRFLEAIEPRIKN